MATKKREDPKKGHKRRRSISSQPTTQQITTKKASATNPDPSTTPQKKSKTSTPTSNKENDKDKKNAQKLNEWISEKCSILTQEVSVFVKSTTPKSFDSNGLAHLTKTCTTITKKIKKKIDTLSTETAELDKSIEKLTMYVTCNTKGLALTIIQDLQKQINQSIRKIIDGVEQWYHTIRVLGLNSAPPAISSITAAASSLPSSPSSTTLSASSGKHYLSSAAASTPNHVPKASSGSAIVSRQQSVTRKQSMPPLRPREATPSPSSSSSSLAHSTKAPSGLGAHNNHQQTNQDDDVTIVDDNDEDDGKRAVVEHIRVTLALILEINEMSEICGDPNSARYDSPYTHDENDALLILKSKELKDRIAESNFLASSSGLFNAATDSTKFTKGGEDFIRIARSRFDRESDAKALTLQLKKRSLISMLKTLAAAKPSIISRTNPPAAHQNNQNNQNSNESNEKKDESEDAESAVTVPGKGPVKRTNSAPPGQLQQVVARKVPPIPANANANANGAPPANPNANANSNGNASAIAKPLAVPNSKPPAVPNYKPPTNTTPNPNANAKATTNGPPPVQPARNNINISNINKATSPPTTAAPIPPRVSPRGSSIISAAIPLPATANANSNGAPAIQHRSSLPDINNTNNTNQFNINTSAVPPPTVQRRDSGTQTPPSLSPRTLTSSNNNVNTNVTNTPSTSPSPPASASPSPSHSSDSLPPLPPRLIRPSPGTASSAPTTPNFSSTITSKSLHAFTAQKVNSLPKEKEIPTPTSPQDVSHIASRPVVHPPTSPQGGSNIASRPAIPPPITSPSPSSSQDVSNIASRPVIPPPITSPSPSSSSNSNQLRRSGNNLNAGSILQIQNIQRNNSSNSAPVTPTSNTNPNPNLNPNPNPQKHMLSSSMKVNPTQGIKARANTATTGFPISSPPSHPPPSHPPPSHHHPHPLSASQHQAQKETQEQKEKRERMREAAVKELRDTETKYYTQLKTLLIEFVNPLKSPDSSSTASSALLKDPSTGSILSNVVNISNLTKQILADLFKSDAVDRIGEVFEGIAPMLKMYQDYINNYESAIQCINESRKRDKSLDSLIKKFCESASQPDISFFLILPIQRLGRYEMLLSTILQHTDVSSCSDQPKLVSALRTIKEINERINRKKAEDKNRNRMMQIQNSMTHVNFKLIESSRLYLREGELRESNMNIRSSSISLSSIASSSAAAYLEYSTAYHWFLFNDLLVKTKDKTKNGNDRYRFIESIALEKVRIELPLLEASKQNRSNPNSPTQSLAGSASETSDGNGTGSSLVIFRLIEETGEGIPEGQERERVIICEDDEIREKWVEDLKDSIRMIQLKSQLDQK